MEKRIICIGGGDLKEKKTRGIDEYIANLAKQRAGERRACGVFIPTASHDFMPYYNTFHKMYTGEFNVKTDVILCANKEPDIEKWKAKLDKADFIYVGGGDTVFMLRQWEKCGLLPLILQAYERGVILTGLSAGAICWFETMYTDSDISENGDENGNEEVKYSLYGGLGILKGTMSPHYEQRQADFDEVIKNNVDWAYGVEGLCALEFVGGELTKSISCGGRAYKIINKGGSLEKIIL